jgi:hypothetical protein
VALKIALSKPTTDVGSSQSPSIDFEYSRTHCPMFKATLLFLVPAIVSQPARNTSQSQESPKDAISPNSRVNGTAMIIPAADTSMNMTLLSAANLGRFYSPWPTTDQVIQWNLEDDVWEDQPSVRARFDLGEWWMAGWCEPGRGHISFPPSEFTGSLVCPGIHRIDLRAVRNDGTTSNIISVTYEIVDTPPQLELISSSTWGSFSAPGPIAAQKIVYYLTDPDNESWELFRRLGTERWTSSGFVNPGIGVAKFPASELLHYWTVGGSYTASIQIMDSTGATTMRIDVSYYFDGVGSSAQIAIGISAGVVGVAAIGGIVFFIWRRRRGAQDQISSLSTVNLETGPSGGYTHLLNERPG